MKIICIEKIINTQIKYFENWNEDKFYNNLINNILDFKNISKNGKTMIKIYKSKINGVLKIKYTKFKDKGYFYEIYNKKNINFQNH